MSATARVNAPSSASCIMRWRRGSSTTERRFPELGEIVAGLKPGRRSDGDITLADLTGTGVQDTAIATLARRLAAQKGLGTVIES